MKAPTMDTVIINSLLDTAEEVKTVNRTVRNRLYAACKAIFTDNIEKHFGLDLSPKMKARIYL